MSGSKEINYEKIFVVIPAYNEQTTIAQVIVDLRSNGFTRLIVVDDGSQDETRRIAENNGAQVLTHVVNCGYGAATATGLLAALKQGADIIATFDADGQHQAVELKKIITPLISSSVEVVVGSRFLVANETTAKQNIPYKRRFFNQLSRLIVLLFYGCQVSDTQSGLRAIKRQALERMSLEASGMEFSVEFIKEAKRLQLNFTEVPIKVLYTNYSVNKGQKGWREAFITGLRLLMRRLLS